MPSVRIAQPPDAAAVTRLMAAFRDHLTLSAPTDEEMATGVARLLGDADTEFLLAAPEDGAPPAGVAQLRFRYGVWRAGGDCLLEDLFVDPGARGAGLGRALIDATLGRARAPRLPPGRARRQRGQRHRDPPVRERGLQRDREPLRGTRPLHAPARRLSAARRLINLD